MFEDHVCAALPPESLQACAFAVRMEDQVCAVCLRVVVRADVVQKTGQGAGAACLDWRSRGALV